MSPALLACVAAAMVVTSNPNPWVEIDDDDGIKVWARDVPGSEVREVKAESIFNLPVETVWAVIKDSSKYPEFMPYIVEMKKVGEHDVGELIYQRIDPPIVDMRDYTVKVSFDEDPENGVYKRSWLPANDEGPPPRDDCVRLTINQGRWTLTRLGSKSTRVVYYLYTNPGGSIPTWMVNRANSNSVPNLMANVRERSRNPNWKRD